MTLSQLDQLKRRARDISKIEGIKLGHALERLAKDAGHRTYAALRATVTAYTKGDPKP